MKYYIIISIIISIIITVDGRLAGECASLCNDLRMEVLSPTICKEAKKTLPRPKVGTFCSNAMEQGFSDACVSLCMDQTPQSRVAQSCRAAAIEMPRPTVRKWCEHGYNTAFTKTIKELNEHFTKDIQQQQQPEPEPPKTNTEPAKEEAKAVETDFSNREVSLTIPVTLDNKTMDLLVHEGESAEEAVIAFCKKNVADDVTTCIRQLVPVVLERIETKPVEI